MEVPDEVTINDPQLFIDMIHSTRSATQPTMGNIGKMVMGYQFHDKIVQINLVPRHKSTDKQGDKDEYEQMDGQTGQRCWQDGQRHDVTD
jgi:hypothetical protein